MATNNAINCSFTLPISQGGTGQVTLTADELVYINASGEFDTITLPANEQLLVVNSSNIPAFATSSDADFTFERTNTSVTFPLVVNHLSGSSVNSDARLDITVGGANVGDPKIQFVVPGGQTWTVGIDNSDNDNYKISASDTLGTTDTFVMNSDGLVNLPLQPAFFAYNSADLSNVTGDGTVYSVVWDSELFDQGGNFASSQFTAPVDGQYMFLCCLQIGVTSSFGLMVTELVTTSLTVELNRLDSGACTTASPTADRLGWPTSAQVFLSSGDTAYIQLTVSGGTQTVTVRKASAESTHFAGYLMC